MGKLDMGGREGRTEKRQESDWMGEWTKGRVGCKTESKSEGLEGELRDR